MRTAIWMAPSVSSAWTYNSSELCHHQLLPTSAFTGQQNLAVQSLVMKLPISFPETFMWTMISPQSPVQEAVTLVKSSQAICASAKLRLHKFASNCKEVLETLPPEDRAKDLKDLDLRHDALPIQRSLGTYWCIESDTLGFRIEQKDKPLSRRGVLSTVSSEFCVRSSWDSFACHPCRETDSTRSSHVGKDGVLNYHR